MQSVHVATAAQARLLLAVELRSLLTLLMKGPCSVSEVASKLDMSVQRAHYVIGKLLKAKVAVVVGERRRNGPSVKLYQVPQPWFIPFDVTTSESLEMFGQQQVIPRVQKMVRSATRVITDFTSNKRGYWLASEMLSLGDEAGMAQQLWAGDEPLLFNFGQVNIPRRKASEFKQRLLALTEEYEQLSNSSEEAYTFAVMLVSGEMEI